MTRSTSIDGEIAILGAGSIGLTLAFELASRGHQVTLFDRCRFFSSIDEALRIPRRSASWAAGGILPAARLDGATDPIEQLRGLSHQRFPSLCERLQALTGVDPQFERCGGLYLSQSAGETASMVGMMAYWEDLGIECFKLTKGDLIEREPALSDWFPQSIQGAAWLVPDECQIHPPLFLASLVEACRLGWVRLVGQTRIVDIREEDTHVEIRAVGSLESAHFEHVVACGGAWLGSMAERLDLSQSIVPVRGQMLLLQTSDRSFRHVLNSGHRYLIPRRSGEVLVGSCEEEVGFQHGTTPMQLDELRSFAFDLIPSLREANELAAWSGLRPMTFDGFPICGKLPSSDRLFVAGGHHRSGIHLAPATAVCLADVIDGKQPPIELDAFRVGKQQSKHDARFSNA